MVQFKLLGRNDPIPSGYRLATTEDVENNQQDLFNAMPGWEIANLANGSVDGASYGGNVRDETRDDVGHKLATRGNASGPHNPQPGFDWEKLILLLVGALSSFFSKDKEGRYETRNDVSQKLATRGNASGPLKFQLFNVGDQLPPSYRLATRYEVESNKEALFQAMPGWEIANLADGSVDGASYGGRTSTAERNDVGHKLAVQGM